MYREVTRGVQIDVEPTFMPEQSKPEAGSFVFAYKIKITNLGEKSTQLISRHWVITDGNGEVHEVEGPGVIGEQPKIEPGASFEYESFCPLPTPTGNMRGTYLMVSGDGADTVQYNAKIPLFFLRDLSKLH